MLVINTMNYELNLAVIDNSRNNINIGLNASIINLAGILNNGADDTINILGLTNYLLIIFLMFNSSKYYFTHI